MGNVNTKLQRDLTLKNRVARRFSQREVADFVGVDKNYLIRLAKTEPSFPVGVVRGRERTFSPDEIMLIRALIGSNPLQKRPHLFWRKPDEELKVVVFGAQKGGTGKSLSSAHFAQYLALTYGMRVGVIDSDPQGTASLYFANEDLPLFKDDTPTLADFMGVDEPGQEQPTNHDAKTLNSFWQPTPWPGLRLLPGGANILSGDVALYFMRATTRIHKVFSNALKIWSDAYKPDTQPGDLRNSDGTFNMEKYEKALSETFDVIIVDQQPSISLMQLNPLVSADTLIIPQTMKGFDLSTLTTFISVLRAYLETLTANDPDLHLGTGKHVVLPTIVQESNDKDTGQILDLYRRAPDLISQVWYSRSDAIANAAEEYKSIYEYQPPDSRRSSARSFLNNANAVNDALVKRVWPELPSRGFAEVFIKEHWGE
ncbi:hypothetical protein RC74_21390 (plasmid) [Falsihalocynthiibacter arcticus]|uniref:Uncharacterized protein n=2 Tax=Falsihalocynthiibacter arcticus TaxID=1579316 RepID=A0A126V7H8_9RHOB|nr:hypothetical protein RC74_21390 [Falsihalocynthiibacter arcticus]